MEQKSHKLQISMTETRYKEVKAAAEAEGLSLSGWINAAIAARLPKSPEKKETKE